MLNETITSIDLENDTANNISMPEINISDSMNCAGILKKPGSPKKFRQDSCGRPIEQGNQFKVSFSEQLADTILIESYKVHNKKEKIPNSFFYTPPEIRENPEFNTEYNILPTIESEQDNEDCCEKCTNKMCETFQQY